MPTSARGSRGDRGRGPGRGVGGRGSARRGFTLIELLIVIALVAIGAGVVSLALRDGASARLEEEAARLAALLEAARAESRATGLTVRWVPAVPGEAADGAETAEGPAFRFVGLPAALGLPQRWIDARTTAQVMGAPALLLGPDAILPPQRLVLALEDHRLEIASDGLGPFVIVSGDAPAAGVMR